MVRYSPTDFSIRGKALALPSNSSVWVTGFAVSLSMTAIAILVWLM